ncbi:MAG: Hpt domain-containing protein [Myxococcales bacterium]|nr:Hpt domain-containing protein [Myxococcales bacterium]
MPNVVVDLSSLRELDEYSMPGEPSLVVEIVGAYLEESEVDSKNLRDAVASGDWAKLGNAAHRLKGSSANVGVKTVVELCAALEKDAKRGPVANANARVNAILEALAASCVILERERAAAEQRG